MKGLAEYPEEDWLALSGIQHFEFCRRQWALIHVEQAWEENYQTSLGHLEHERTDDYSNSEKRGEFLSLKGLRVFSRILGVSGVCDTVEFYKDKDGAILKGRKGTWRPFPVEYKHGISKEGDEDRLQLCCEAMCLEEMLSTSINEGALFYRRTVRRETVEFDDELRAHVKEDLSQMHLLMSSGHTPRAKYKPRCRSCSLKDLCLPELDKRQSASHYIAEELSEILDQE